MVNSDEIDFSEDVDESSVSDSNTKLSIADKMNEGLGYELKVHKNSEAMAKIVINKNIIKKNNFLVNLNMNSGEPN